MPPAKARLGQPRLSTARPRSTTATDRVSKGKGKARKAQNAVSHKRKRGAARDQESSSSPPEEETDERVSSSDDGSAEEVTRDQSSEPDFILAEVTHEDSSRTSEEAEIPSDLLQRILHEHFQDKTRTKISTGAKGVVAKYIDVFVREAILRADYERQGGEEKGDSTDEGLTRVAADGWLEVEHLEKVGAQMCLDF